jgi:hypothetical protein
MRLIKFLGLVLCVVGACGLAEGISTGQPGGGPGENSTLCPGTVPNCGPDSCPQRQNCPNGGHLNTCTCVAT